MLHGFDKGDVMNIRKYEKNDASKVLSWFDTKEEFELWEAERFKKYPITARELNAYYEKENVDAYTFIFEGALAGHFAIKFLNKKIARLFLIVLDKSIRGKGLGKKMVVEGMKLAKSMGAEEVSICVFDQNEGAVGCYKSLGFEYSGYEEEYAIGKYREMKKSV